MGFCEGDRIPADARLIEAYGLLVNEASLTGESLVLSVSKRLPKILGSLVGGGVAMAVGFWLNLSLAFGFVVVACIVQFFLLRRMRPTNDPPSIPIRQVLAQIQPDLRRLLSAEIVLRWGDWFVRDFGVILDSALRRGWLKI